MGDAFPRVMAAVVQAAPVVLDRERTLDRIEALAAEAAGRGARLVVFPEAFVPAYPASPVFGPVFGGFFDPQAGAAFRRLAANAVEVPGAATERLGGVAKSHGLHLCVGVNERTRTGTLHCTLLLFGPTGELLQARRKLVPTHDERMVWGPGEARAPTTVETSYGAIGQLACWENYMPLCRMSLYQGGERIHLAPTADASDGWQATLRHIALEGRVFVLASNQYVTRAHYPADFELAETLRAAPEVLCRGGSAIVAPDGGYLAGPLYGEEGILTAELDLGAAVEGKQLLDVAGHYARPDALRLATGD
ncbi:MAG TPA: carbon-nitrogen hydrolase family protein [Vicinamibacteria bacterium]|nr:carbon-nitrogen hydrolase family protein [Vicinamibacteria bacterium]